VSQCGCTAEPCVCGGRQQGLVSTTGASLLNIITHLESQLAKQAEVIRVAKEALEQAREQNPIRLFIDGWIHTSNCPCYICEALARIAEMEGK
jgi:hypothetical protein